MGDLLKDKDLTEKVWAIFANYLLGEELEYILNDLTELPLTAKDLPLLEKTFMEDIAPACHLLPFYVDSYWYTFSSESIAELIMDARKHKPIRVISKIIFLYYRHIYKDSWQELKDGLIARWKNSCKYDSEE